MSRFPEAALLALAALIAQPAAAEFGLGRTAVPAVQALARRALPPHVVPARGRIADRDRRNWIDDVLHVGVSRDGDQADQGDDRERPKKRSQSSSPPGISTPRRARRFCRMRAVSPHTWRLPTW